MKKCEELITPSSCLNKAFPEEPIFVLRANDPCAAQAVRLWCAMAVGLHEPEKIEYAHKLASDMEQWRAERESKQAPPCEPAPLSSWPSSAVKYSR